MATLKSKTVTVSAPVSEVFEYLSNLNHLEELMPEERVINWQSDTESCSFQIKGLARIGMRKVETDPHKRIHLVSDGKNPFDFTLDLYTTGDDQQTEAHFVFEGKMNPMMKMMVEKPLTNFFNMLADKLVEVKG